MTEHKRLHQITRAIRAAIAEALFTASNWLLDAAYWAGPYEPTREVTPLSLNTIRAMMENPADWQEGYVEICREAWEKVDSAERFNAVTGFSPARLKEQGAPFDADT